MGQCDKCRTGTQNGYLFGGGTFCKPCYENAVIQACCLKVLAEMPSYDYRIKSDLLWKVGTNLMELSKEVIEIHHGKEL